MNREKYHAFSGTYETPVYRLEADEDGPTAVILGGVHGNETTSWEAAELIRLWTISRGTIIVIPRANRPACENGTRQAPGEPDLNRQFPSGRDPRTNLARALWDEITSHDPDYVFDLHRSIGLSGGRSPSGVGQCIFPTPDGREAAENALGHMNDGHVPADKQDTHYFEVGNDQNGRNPLISHKVGGDLDAMGWLVETTSHEQSPALQRDQLEHAVETLLYHGAESSGSRIRVDDYGHHEHTPDEDVLAAYEEESAEDELTQRQQVAQEIVEGIRSEYDLP